MVRNYLNILLTIFLVGALANSVLARKKADNLTQHSFEWKEVTEADWEIPTDSIYEGHQAIMLFEDIIADDKKLQDDECHRTVYHRIRILGEDGRKWADVEIPIYDDEQEIELIRGRTILRDGTIVELGDDNIFEKEIVRTEDQKVDQVSFSIPGVTNDCILEYAYKIKAEGYTPYWIIQKDIPLMSGRIHWILAEFKTLAYFADMAKSFVTPNYLLLNRYSDMHVKHIPNVAEAKELILTVDATPAYKSEPVSFPEAWTRTRMATYYSSNVPSASYWGKEATDINEAINQYCKNDRRLNKVVEEIEALPDEESRVVAAYNWVCENIQEVRDLRSEHDAKFSDKDAKKRQRDLKIKERNDLDDILKHGYGTRTDKSVVLVALLRRLGMDASLAYVVDRSDDIFTEKIKHWQFDVPLVSLRRDGKSSFYAPGYLYLSPGRVPWFAEGVNALVSGVEEYLQPVPFTKPSENSILCSYEYQITDDMKLQGDVKSRRTGHPARSLRVELRWKDTTSYAGVISDHLSSDYPDANVDTPVCENTESADTPLNLTWKIAFPELEAQGNMILLKPFDYFYKLENDFVTEERKWPILFPYAYELRESGRIEVPEGWTIKAVPIDTSYENGVGKIAMSIQTLGNAILIQRTFTLESPFLRAEGYKHVRDLMGTRQEMSSAVVVLERSIN